MTDGQFVERGTLDLWDDTMREQRDRIGALTAERDRLRALLSEADRRIVWEAHGFGNDFSERVEAALKGGTP